MPSRLAVRVRRNARVVALVFAVVLFAGPQAFAGPFTDPTAFMAAIAGLPGTTTTLDFESASAGTTIPDGGSLGGITFTNSIGLDLIVSTGFATTSGVQYLGVDDGGDEVFLPPTDLWEMSSATPLQALGLYFITSDPLVAGDVRLETSAGSAANSEPEIGTLSDGGLVYFLGFVSDGLPFSGAQVRYGVGVQDFFVYNVDDITTVSAAATPTPVPEPSSLLLATTGLAALWARRRSLRAKRHDQGVANA